MSKHVFIPNKSAHNFSDAERYGELVFLTEGTVARYNVSGLAEKIADKMRKAEKADFILITSLNILNSITTAIFARRFGRVNYLMFRDGHYIDRSIIVDDLYLRE
jgi:hypothetical protein